MIVLVENMFTINVLPDDEDTSDAENTLVGIISAFLQFSVESVYINVNENCIMLKLGNSLDYLKSYITLLHNGDQSDPQLLLAEFLPLTACDLHITALDRPEVNSWTLRNLEAIDDTYTPDTITYVADISANAFILTDNAYKPIVLERLELIRHSNTVPKLHDDYDPVLKDMITKCLTVDFSPVANYKKSESSHKKNVDRKGNRAKMIKRSKKRNRK